MTRKQRRTPLATIAAACPLSPSHCAVWQDYAGHMAKTLREEQAVVATYLAEAMRLLLRTPVEWRQAVRSGLPFSSFDALADYAQLSPALLGQLLGIPQRTISRRRSAGQLTTIESDRLYRLAQVITQAVEVLGSREKARIWLLAPNRSLGGDVPMELLDTEIGSQQVEDVLTRLNYGIYS